MLVDGGDDHSDAQRAGDQRVIATVVSDLRDWVCPPLETRSVISSD